LISDFILIFVAVLYLLIVGILFIYGLNFFYLTYLSWRAGGHTEIIPAIDEWPSVTIQLPIYNERYVAQRLIEAILKLEYPQNLLEIQVLDDSTDDTFTGGGVSSGLYANIPTCDADADGYGYWATDMGGNWNTSAEFGGEDGALYVCDGVDTWDLYWTPVTYPHPLTGERSTTTGSGTGLRRMIGK